jgi:hypothetical protein
MMIGIRAEWAAAPVGAASLSAATVPTVPDSYLMMQQNPGSWKQVQMIPGSYWRVLS